MSKIALAIGAALLAGTTLTSAANAGGIRLGFGFPLGSFVAHSNQGYSDAPCRRCDRPQYTPQRRAYVADAPPVRKARPMPKATYAQIPVEKAVAAPVVTTAKLDDKLPATTDVTPAIDKAAASAANTTTLTKTLASTNGSTANKDSDQATTNTAATPVAAATTLPAVTVETPKVEKVAAFKADKAPMTEDTKQVCRRYSPTVGGLVDVPCDQ